MGLMNEQEIVKGSAITDRERLEGLHSDAEMWGYRSISVGLDELTTTAGCEPQPRLVTVDQAGRERSHREATAAHDARVRAAEAAAGAGQQHGAAAVVGGDRIERRGQFAMEDLVEGIEAIGPVQSELRPAFSAVNQQYGIHAPSGVGCASKPLELTDRTVNL